MIHPKSVEVQENKEVVYDIVKSKKGFFARLADAFRKQHADTIQVSNRSRKAVTDSARHSINIADTVAGVLKEIKREELKARRHARSSSTRSGRRSSWWACSWPGA